MMRSRGAAGPGGLPLDGSTGQNRLELVMHGTVFAMHHLLTHIFFDHGVNLLLIWLTFSGNIDHNSRWINSLIVFISHVE